MAGGTLMAMFSMIMLWLARSGSGRPLNLIAHTFWRSAPLDGRFSAVALAIGMAVHMTMAIPFGTLIAAAAVPLTASRSLMIAAGMLFTAALWAMMQYGTWRAVDATAAVADPGPGSGCAGTGNSAHSRLCGKRPGTGRIIALPIGPLAPMPTGMEREPHNGSQTTSRPRSGG